MKSSSSQKLLNDPKQSNVPRIDNTELKFCLSWCLVTCAVLAVVFFIMLFWFHTLHRSTLIGDTFMASMFNTIQYRTPVILAWTKFNGDSLIEQFKPSKTCPYKCVFTDNRESYENSARVRIFHAPDVSIEDLPLSNVNAFNVFYSMDSPVNMEYKWNYINKTVLSHDYFNLTIGYQQDSNIQYPFDVLEPKSINDSDDEYYADVEVEQAIDNKTELALISMSNCRSDSNRELLIEQLKQIVPLTTVGDCYNSTCDEECLRELEKTHYFYLAFEDSVCPDYMTQEFWSLKHLIVPVVLSRSVVSSYIPSYTFIAVDDFPTLQQFTNYLFQVLKDRELYKSYFAWTETYKRTSRVREFLDPGCELCKIAHRQKRYQLKNIEKFLSHNQCKHAFGSFLLSSDRHNRTWEMT